jgi:dTDP-4-amino-4,6-dideoxygalactose transaminase
MSEVAAAIGLVQLERLDGALARRREIAECYRAETGAATTQEPAPGTEPSLQTFGLLLPPGIDRARAVDALRERGVEAGLLSYALHRLPTIAPDEDGRFPVASTIADRGLALPLHAQLSDDDVTLVIDALRGILRAG